MTIQTRFNVGDTVVPNHPAQPKAKPFVVAEIKVQVWLRESDKARLILIQYRSWDPGLIPGRWWAEKDLEGGQA